MHAIAPNSHAPAATPAAVLSFWLGAPAAEPATLLMKFQRWYQGGEAVDSIIRARFGALIESALGGALQPWIVKDSGRLALVIVLDQFTRNVYRGTARAYAGDAQALSIALSTVDTELYRRYSLEERLFMLMPLVHAEELGAQTRAVALAHELVRDAPAELRDPWRLGYERIAHYRSIIQRFGRFPHRNTALGRSSTTDELAFLEEEVKKAPSILDDSAARASRP